MSFAQRKSQEDEGTIGSGGTARGSSSASATSTSNTNNNHINDVAEPSPATTGSAGQSTSVESDPGKLLNGGTTYVDSSHWQAILDDVCRSCRIL